MIAKCDNCGKKLAFQTAVDMVPDDSLDLFDDATYYCSRACRMEKQGGYGIGFFTLILVSTIVLGLLAITYSMPFLWIIAAFVFFYGLYQIRQDQLYEIRKQNNPV